MRAKVRLDFFLDALWVICHQAAAVGREVHQAQGPEVVVVVSIQHDSLSLSLHVLASSGSSCGTTGKSHSKLRFALRTRLTA